MINSIRVRLLLSLLAMLAVAALVMGGVTYRSVLEQTEALFDYQLRQMALSLRDQGEIASSQAGALADEQLDFVVQIWTVDGRSIYASRQHSTLPERALLGLADIKVDGQVWRTYGVATRDRVIQVAQPLHTRRHRDSLIPDRVHALSDLRIDFAGGCRPTTAAAVGVNDASWTVRFQAGCP